MKVLKSQLKSVNCMKFDNHSEGSKSMYEEKSSVTTMVTTNGTVACFSRDDSEMQSSSDSRLCAIDRRNGGPTLKTIPDRMYS